MLRLLGAEFLFIELSRLYGWVEIKTRIRPVCSQEYADSNVYENEDGYDSGYRYPRRPVLRRRPMIGRRPYPRRPYPRRPIYREPTVHEYGRSAYYWSCAGGYGLRFTSHDSGYYGSDESVSIQVGRIDTSRPYHGYTVRLKRSCSF